ncbi:hypothetical protein FB45DRAFT_1054208 [Roridomyces roridus]|uniref:Extracellular membrane protein CFEM domain-containing protein n=1 Tax=Roridomyces roridus TaxID=1738132 RepID=A0AAD7C8U1_9AGAR|nr:hypothetical protein FB45DRAFT_1054208 [Roridomyces roridus]
MLTLFSYPLLASACVLLTAAAEATPTSALLGRQAPLLDPSQIPSQCQSNCTVLVDDANTCTNFQCLCTPANDAAVLSCVNCVISFNHTGSVIISGQDILNQYASECNQNNISISTLSASGVGTVTGTSTMNLNPSFPPSVLAQSTMTSPVGSLSTSPSSSTAAANSPSGTSTNKASVIVPHSTDRLWMAVGIMLAIAIV